MPGEQARVLDSARAAVLDQERATVQDCQQTAVQHRQREGGLYILKITLINYIFCLRHAQYLTFEHVLLFSKHFLLFLNISISAMFNVLREPVLDCE